MAATKYQTHYTAAAFGYDAARVLSVLADRIADEHIDNITEITLTEDTLGYTPVVLLYDGPHYCPPTPFTGDW